MPVSLVLAFTFILCLALGAAASPADANWNEQFPVAVPSGDDDGAGTPAVVADADGNFTYVWRQEREDAGSDIVARVSRHDGTLGPTQIVAGAGNDVDYFDTPTASIGGDGAVRVAWVWSQQIGPTCCDQMAQIQYTTLDADGSPAAPPTTLDGAASNLNDSIWDLRLDTGADNGSTLIWTFVDDSAGTVALKAATVDGGGTASGSIEVASNAFGTNWFNGITLSRGDSGRSFIGWIDDDTYRVVGRMLGQDGQLTPATALSTVGDYLNGIDSTIDSQDKATVIYEQEAGGSRQDVMLRQMSAAGSAVGAGAQLVSDGNEDAYLNGSGGQGQLAASGGDYVTLGYRQRQPGCCTTEAQLRTVAPDGTLGNVQGLSPAGWNAEQVTVAFSPDGTGTALTSAQDGSRPITVQASDLTRTGTLSGPATTLDEIADGTWPSLATPASAANGDAAALWSVEISSAGYAAGLFSAINTVSAPRVTIWAPSKATAGQEIVAAAEGASRNRLSYDWTFDGRDATSGEIVRHTFSQPGTFEIEVTATDGNGMKGSATATVEVLAAGGGNRVAPNTRITKKPAKTTKSRKASFKFVSSIAGSRFECRLDKAGWSSCKSPKKLKKLRPGKHSFRVRAVKDGLLDQSPAKFTWKVKKPKKKAKKKSGRK